MLAEHTRRADSQIEFRAGNYGVVTTSLIEWWFVVDPESALAAKVGGTRWPSEATDKLEPSLCREAIPLVVFLTRAKERNEQLMIKGQPPLIKEEVDRRQKEKDKILRQKKYWQVDPGTDLDAFEEE